MAVMALVLFIVPACATDVSIPINKDYKYGDMVIHLISVNITDYPMGNVYSPDPDNTTWPRLVFQYENTGTEAINGNLQVAFFDDQGNQYPANKKIVDITMDQVQPGKKSDVRFVEAAVIPRNTKITSFKVYEDFKTTSYNISYDSPGIGTQPATTSAKATPSVSIMTALFIFTMIGTLIMNRMRS
jgi:hypothetical protein